MSFEAFQARAKHGHLVPVWRECVLDTETPVAAFTKLKRGPFSFLLESAPAGERNVVAVHLHGHRTTRAHGG